MKRETHSTTMALNMSRKRHIIALASSPWSSAPLATGTTSLLFRFAFMSPLFLLHDPTRDLKLACICQLIPPRQCQKLNDAGRCRVPIRQTLPRLHSSSTKSVFSRALKREACTKLHASLRIPLLRSRLLLAALLDAVVHQDLRLLQQIKSERL